MMGRQTADQTRLFYEFHLEDRVPANHLLRRINVFVTAALGDLHKELAPYYSHTGRPSIDPELMIRMLILGYCYAIRSERRLCEEVEDRLAFRWFCRLDLDDAVPDHSTFSKNRHGRFRDSGVLRHVFERVVAACIATGLVVPLALGAPGNLDTNFADHGRALLETEFGGQVWAVEALDNGEVFVAGGGDGALDTSFGEGGKFVGPHLDNSALVFIERTAAAGYRLTTTSHSRCQVLGLTAGGVLDNSFGDAGIADIGGALDVASSCRSMISQSDGSLLVAGIVIFMIGLRWRRGRRAAATGASPTCWYTSCTRRTEFSHENCRARARPRRRRLRRSCSSVST